MCDDFCQVFRVISRVATLLVEEHMAATDGQVQLLGTLHAEHVHIEGLKEAVFGRACRVHSGFVEALELDLLGHLVVFDDTLTGVRAKVACIQSESEVIGSGVKDLDRASFVQLRHALDLDELDVIAVLVSVSSVLMNVDSWVLALLDVRNDELLGGFAVFVFDSEVGAVVQEGVRAETERLAEDKANPVLSANLVDCPESFSGPHHLSDANDVVVCDHIVGELWEDIGSHVRVELTELGDRGLSSGRVRDVLLLDVKVGAHVIDSDCGGVVDGD